MYYSAKDGNDDNHPDEYVFFQLENKLRMVPRELEKAEEDLMEHQQRYDSMTQLRPIKENVRDILLLCCGTLFLRAESFFLRGTIERS